MPDWNALVRERLKVAEFSQVQQDEIAAELASHLDDLYRECRKQGLSESEAVARALQEVPDWQGLAKTIHRAKREEGIMNDRTKRVWLPGLASIAIALVLPILLFMALSRLGIGPRILTRFAVARFDFLWLLAAAFGGAAGAWLSRRAGGKRFAQLASALLPTAVLVIAICCVSSCLVLAPSFRASQFISSRELTRALSMISVYGGALLLGALPFLRPRSRSESEVSHA
jgi:hypothetical protein